MTFSALLCSSLPIEISDPGGHTISMRDLNPSRVELMLRNLHLFISKFFEENPLSQLQLIQTSDGIAKVITPLSGTLH